jgi:hypothetical protein
MVDPGLFAANPVRVTRAGSLYAWFHGCGRLCENAEDILKAFLSQLFFSDLKASTSQ